jgi:hypothetical protein
MEGHWGVGTIGVWLVSLSVREESLSALFLLSVEIYFRSRMELACWVALAFRKVLEAVRPKTKSWRSAFILVETALARRSADLSATSLLRRNATARMALAASGGTLGKQEGCEQDRDHFAAVIFFSGEDPALSVEPPTGTSGIGDRAGASSQKRVKF